MSFPHRVSPRVSAPLVAVVALTRAATASAAGPPPVGPPSPPPHSHAASAGGNGAAEPGYSSSTAAVPDATAQQQPAKPAPPPLKISGTWYLSYQGLDADPSAFLIKRGYITIESQVLPYMSARITPDVNVDSTGDIKVRLKYAYAQFHAPDLGVVTRPAMEVGVAHTPWLDFEEYLNLYRMQDTMFMERNGLFNSADFGFTLMGLLGGTLSDDYQKTVSSSYPGRWGSFALGVYNGGGYHAAEKNDDKAREGRLTLRPLPDALPGLQLSLFAVRGKGNTAAAPVWAVNAVMLSYQCRSVVLTAQWVDATGNQKGTAVSPLGRSLDQEGWSLFAEGKLTPRWSIIARYDTFDPDTGTLRDENRRSIAGIAHHLGKGNTVLLDIDRVSYVDPTRPDATRLQLTLQVKY